MRCLFFAAKICAILRPWPLPFDPGDSSTTYDNPMIICCRAMTRLLSSNVTDHIIGLHFNVVRPVEKKLTMCSRRPLLNHIKSKFNPSAFIDPGSIKTCRNTILKLKESKFISSKSKCKCKSSNNGLESENRVEVQTRVLQACYGVIQINRFDHMRRLWNNHVLGIVDPFSRTISATKFFWGQKLNPVHFFRRHLIAFDSNLLAMYFYAGFRCRCKKYSFNDVYDLAMKASVRTKNSTVPVM